MFPIQKSILKTFQSNLKMQWAINLFSTVGTQHKQFVFSAMLHPLSFQQYNHVHTIGYETEGKLNTHLPILNHLLRCLVSYSNFLNRF